MLTLSSCVLYYQNLEALVRCAFVCVCLAEKWCVCPFICVLSRQFVCYMGGLHDEGGLTVPQIESGRADKMLILVILFLLLP